VLKVPGHDGISASDGGGSHVGSVICPLGIENSRRQVSIAKIDGTDRKKLEIYPRSGDLSMKRSVPILQRDARLLEMGHVPADQNGSKVQSVRGDQHVSVIV
jgi:hypothetical protein